MRSKRSDAANYSALTVVQAANALVPLVVFPVVLLRVGEDQFSNIVISEAISVVALTVALFSFDVDAIRRVVNKTLPADAAEISRAFSEVLSTRLFLLAGIGGVLFAVSTIVWSASIAAMLLLWLLIPVGVCLQSAWLFQGLETNVPVAIGAIIGKLVTVALIFLMVNEPSDSFYVPAALGLGAILSGLIPITYLMAFRGLTFNWVKLKRIRELIFKGRLIFFGNASVMLYRDINVILLGLIGAPSFVVSSYALAEKVVKSVQALVRPLNQLYFPKAVRSLSGLTDPTTHAFRQLTSQAVPQLVFVALLCSTGILVFLNVDLSDLFGIKDDSGELITGIASIMLPTIIFGVVTFVYGVVGLNHLGGQLYFFRGLAIVGFANVVVCLTLASILQGWGAAIAFLISEMLLATIVCARYMRKPGAKYDAAPVTQIDGR